MMKPNGFVITKRSVDALSVAGKDAQGNRIETY